MLVAAEGEGTRDVHADEVVAEHPSRFAHDSREVGVDHPAMIADRLVSCLTAMAAGTGAGENAALLPLHVAGQVVLCLAIAVHVGLAVRRRTAGWMVTVGP